LQNTIEEYLSTSDLQEIIVTIEELIENEVIAKSICIGHFLLTGFSKKTKECLLVYKMIIELLNKSHIGTTDIQEGIMVALANFYDAMIDFPNSPEHLKETLEAFESLKVIDKEFVQSVNSHIEAMKKQLDEEYTE